MRRYLSIPGLLLLLLAGSAAAEFSGNVALEAQLFTESPQFDDQFDENLTASFKPKWDGEWNEGDDLWSLELFFRDQFLTNEEFPNARDQPLWCCVHWGKFRHTF